MLSERCNLTPVANLLVQADPKTVLDVGVGFGNYGMIARAFLDVWRGRLFKKDWKFKIDGIEYYKDFKTPLYDYIYNSIFFGDVVEVLPKLEKYECIIIMHVIEHFEKKQAIELLKLIRARCTKLIIVGTPSLLFSTGYPNYPKEQHRCLFSALEFNAMGYRTITLPPHEILAWKKL